MSEDWRLFTQERYETFCRNRQQQEVVHGKELVAGLDRFYIDPLMFVKAGILGDDHSPNHALRDRLDRNRLPADLRPVRVPVPLEFVTSDKARALDRTFRVQAPVRPNPDQVANIYREMVRWD